MDAAFTEAVSAGARSVLVVSDGFDRCPAHGADPVAELGSRARESGVRLVGPSSLGVVDTGQQLRLAWGEFTAGPVAVVAQSGQVGSELANLLARLGSGVSRFASVGAQADVSTEELLAELVEHRPTRAVIGYVEGVRDAEGFLCAAHRLGSGPVVVERMDMRRAAVELLAGVRYDPGFGPVVLVGAGGTAAELWDDTVLELAPVTAGLAADMLSRLQCWPLLRGWRGAAACDVAAVARAVAALSELPLADPSVLAAELNPLRAGPDGVLALDALVHATEPAGGLG